MIEYLHSTIRATAGDSVTITAKITDSAGAAIQEICSLCLYDGNTKLLEVEGILEENIHNFTIAADVTAALTGRYWYKVYDSKHNSLDFAQPIYFVTRGKANSDFENGRAFEQARLKPELKAAIEERGTVIPVEANVDEYARYLRSCPNFAIGTFTPEEDTEYFSVTDLPFKPSTLSIYYPHHSYDEYETGKLQIIQVDLHRDSNCFIKVIKGEYKYSNMAMAPAAAPEYYNFTNDSVHYSITGQGTYFRAGYTYHYIVV